MPMQTQMPMQLEKQEQNEFTQDKNGKTNSIITTEGTIINGSNSNDSTQDGSIDVTQQQQQQQQQVPPSAASESESYLSTLNSQSSMIDRDVKVGININGNVNGNGNGNANANCNINGSINNASMSNSNKSNESNISSSSSSSLQNGSMEKDSSSSISSATNGESISSNVNNNIIVNGSNNNKVNGDANYENGTKYTINGKNGESNLSSASVSASVSASPTTTNGNFNKSNNTDVSIQTMTQQPELLNIDDPDLSQQDLDQIEQYWDKLMPHVSYLGTTNSAKIKEALKVAYISHKHQKRKSGEPFIIHPIEVAILLTSLYMDAETIMAGLLHDTVEDTNLTFDQIERKFGLTVRTIVEGETKVSKLPKLQFSSYADEQAENLRQMFVAMTDDYRIIIVKLADRLHNMRTLQFMKPEKQYKISRETLDIFAPLAHRMGIWQFKSELEDISFMYLYPAEYEKLQRNLNNDGPYKTKLNSILDYSKDILSKTLKSDALLQDQAVDVQVQGRTKELYSLYHKMTLKGEDDLDRIKDVVALRVIIEPRKRKGSNVYNGDGNGGIEGDEDVNDGVVLCYHVLGLVQHLPGFQPVPKSVKDYISFPKPNGYQSLHTALMLSGQTIEVQIRTSAMHKIAEYGMASHWAYIDGKYRQDTNSAQSSDSGNENLPDLYNTPWLSSIKEWEGEVHCSRDFVDCVRRELLGKRVFVFLRNGKILNLSKGSTVIDAAFQIHTEVGLNMHGAEINGKPVSISYELKNGDVVSVLTGKGKPATDWMKFATIRSTRSKLRSYFRRMQKQSLREAGVILLKDFLDMYREVIQESSFLEEPFDVPTSAEEIAQFLPGNTNYQNIDDLLIDIGKCHDRNFMRTAIAKIFLVPQKVLCSAEDDRHQALSNQMLDVVNAKRQIAMDASIALGEENHKMFEDDFEAELNDKPNGFSTVKYEYDINGSGSLQTMPQGTNGETNTFSQEGNMSINGSTEIADPEHICSQCLPIFGDDIVGTRPHGLDANDFVATVHRRSCGIVLKAKNESMAKQGEENNSNKLEKFSSNNTKPKESGSEKATSLKSRLIRHFSGLNQSSINNSSRAKKQFSGNEGKKENPKALDLVELAWDRSYEAGEKNSYLYLTELSLICNDRKQLLADCSEVVSDKSEIVKTGSITTKEHAILNFLVKVESLGHLQKLMNSLREIPSVMSVERKFGSDL